MTTYIEKPYTLIVDDDVETAQGFISHYDIMREARYLADQIRHGKVFSVRVKRNGHIIFYREQ